MTRKTIAAQLYQTLLELGWSPPGQLRATPIQQTIDNHTDGYWTRHPLYDIWLIDVVNGNTREGFWEWLYTQHDPEEK